MIKKSISGFDHVWMIAVADGHGNNGHLVSKQIKAILVSKFEFEDKKEISNQNIHFIQDTNLNVQEYRIRITVSLTLTDAATGKVLWSESSFTGETTYFLTGSGSTTQSAAIDAALTDLATRVVERTVENW